MSASMSGSTRWARGSSGCRSGRPTPTSHEGYPRAAKASDNRHAAVAVLPALLAGARGDGLLAGIRQHVDIVIQTFLDAAAAGTDARTEAVIIRRTGLPRFSAPVLRPCARQLESQQTGQTGRSKDCP